ncbi:MAG: hypothetical protein K2N54_03780 [Helicobacter sp.]|nr:hypothetical protein [Helicobacter sp.]
MAPHGLCPYSTALRLCYAFGSNIDVARCGWDARMMSNSRSRTSKKYIKSQKIPIVIASERRERGNQPC